MSPRPYRMDKRQTARNETRVRILEAARHLLTDDSTRELSMDAVAKRADVSRLTIYYQFGSRPGLLEALYDHLAARGNMQRMAQVFQAPDQVRAVEEMIATFVGFWSVDTTVMRRLRAMAALDREISGGVRARDARRVHIAHELLKRSPGKRRSGGEAVTADVLAMLTSFETYDALARAGHAEDQIVLILRRLARCAISDEGNRTQSPELAKPRRSGQRGRRTLDE